MELFKRLEMRAYLTWLTFAIRYRKTLIGPAWLLIGPFLFISMLGILFSEVSGISRNVFVPHLTVGLIAWTLISGFITSSTTVFQRARPQIIQGNMRISDIVMVDIFTTVLLFLHQSILIVAVFIYFSVGISFYTLISFIGLALLIANGIWLTYAFGIVGARYRDLTEVVQAVMRIAFLATPIIWIPGEPGRGGVMGAFLIFNPFYHFLELIRAPLLNTPIAPQSWVIVLTITTVGFGLAFFLRHRFIRSIPLWI